MSDHTRGDSSATDDETPDSAHDASPGGAINAPADEPDPASETQTEQGDAGRRRGTDDA